MIVLANIVHDNTVGICFFLAGGNEARDNTAEGNDGTLSGCCFKLDHNTVRDNAGFGILVEGASDCSVDENTVARNGLGIQLDVSSSCQLYRNVVQQNASIGINAVLLEAGNVFLFNTSSGNRELDCYWDGSDAPTFTANRCLTETPAGAWE